MSLPKLQKITSIIEGLFDNQAGKVLNTGPNPHTLIFAGDETNWGCIALGALALEDVPGLLGYISYCWWIDTENPAESSDMLKVFATPVR